MSVTPGGSVSAGTRFLSPSASFCGLVAGFLLIQRCVCAGPVFARAQELLTDNDDLFGNLIDLVLATNYIENICGNKNEDTY